jgi:hypothetical protein
VRLEPPCPWQPAASSQNESSSDARKTIVIISFTETFYSLCIYYPWYAEGCKKEEIGMQHVFLVTKQLSLVCVCYLQYSL